MAREDGELFGTVPGLSTETYGGLGMLRLACKGAAPNDVEETLVRPEGIPRRVDEDQREVHVVRRVGAIERVEGLILLAEAGVDERGGIGRRRAG